MKTDLTFFTNEPDSTLLDRFKATLTDVHYFDVLVGYFRTSGFRLMAEAMGSAKQIRILVGLNVDQQTFELIEEDRTQRTLLAPSEEARTAFIASVTEEMAHAVKAILVAYEMPDDIAAFAEKFEIRPLRIQLASVERYFNSK